MNAPLVVVAVVILLLGVLLRRLRMVPKVGSALIVVGVAYGVAAAVAPRLGDSSEDGFKPPSVAIVEPADGATVESGERVPIEIDLTNAKISTSASDTKNGHLHIYVDGRLQNMPFTTTTEVRLSPGEHEIKVEYVDWQHVSYVPKVQSSITVVARG